VALSQQFISLLNLTENFYEILSKPISSYTYYQIDLLSYGRFFKYVLNSDPKPPENIQKNPEELEEWFTRSASRKKIIQNSQNSAGQIIMGGTDSDIKEIFKNEEVVNIDTEIKKKGRLNMAEMMKLHGF